MAVKSNVSNSEKSAQPDALEVRTIAGLLYQKTPRAEQKSGQEGARKRIKIRKSYTKYQAHTKRNFRYALKPLIYKAKRICFLTGGQKVAGSNPVAPIPKAFRNKELRKASFL